MKAKVFYCLKVKFLTGKQRQGKGSPSNLAHMAKVSDRMRFKVLPRVLAQIKAGNTSDNVLNEVRKICIAEIKLLKKCKIIRIQ